MRAVAARGRWVWLLSGLVTSAVLVVPAARLITLGDGVVNASAEPQVVTTRTVTVPQPVTSLTVQSDGGQVQVTAGPVSRVQVTETIMYDPQAGGPGVVAESVSGGRVATATATITTGGGNAMVTFAKAPESVSVSTDGGAVILAVPGGPYAVAADSNGGPQSVTIATDPDARPTLAVTSGGGTLQIEPAPR